MITAYNFNHNPDASLVLKNLMTGEKDLNKSISRVSTGEKIQQANDNPSSFVITENLKSQLSGIKQTNDNIDNNINFLQSIDAQLEEVNTLLLELKTLAIQAANTATSNDTIIAQLQLEVEIILKKLSQISEREIGGSQNPLNKIGVVLGEVSNQDFVFLGADATVQSSPIEGYKIEISTLPSQSNKKALVELSQDLITAGEEINITVEHKSLKYITKENDTFSTVVNALNNIFIENEMPLHVVNTEESIEKELLDIFHTEFGSKYSFKVSSSTPGMFSKKANQFVESKPGKDIAGKIDTVRFRGDGNEIYTDNQKSHVSGLKLLYQGQLNGNNKKLTKEYHAGDLYINNTALRFQIDEREKQYNDLALFNIHPLQLAQNVDNKIGLQNLSEVNIEDFEHANASLSLIERAINEISSLRGKIGSSQKNKFEAGKKMQEKKFLNIIQMKSQLTDANIAKEISEVTNDQIQLNASISLLAQANQKPSSVINLLN